MTVPIEPQPVLPPQSVAPTLSVAIDVQPDGRVHITGLGPEHTGLNIVAASVAEALAGIGSILTGGRAVIVEVDHSHDAAPVYGDTGTSAANRGGVPLRPLA